MATRPFRVARPPRRPTARPPQRPAGQPRSPFRTPRVALHVPEGLGRAPRSTDVVVDRGFDGRTPAKASARIRGQLTSPVAPENEALVQEAGTLAYTAFTIAVNNVLVPNSPMRAALEKVGAGNEVTVLGQMGPGSDQVVYRVPDEAGGPPRHYIRDWTGNLAPFSRKFGNVVLEGTVRFEPPGVAVAYPAWSNAGLARVPRMTFEIVSVPPGVDLDTMVMPVLQGLAKEMGVVLSPKHPDADTSSNE